MSAPYANRGLRGGASGDDAYGVSISNEIEETTGSAVERLLTPAISMRQGFALITLIAALSVLLLSDIWQLFLIGILGGCIMANLRFWLGPARTEAVQSEAPGIARIDSSKIPISGGVGAGILIAVLLTGVLLDLPSLRLLAAPGILAGLVFAVILRLFRRSHREDSAKEWLSIRPKGFAHKVSKSQFLHCRGGL